MWHINFKFMGHKEREILWKNEHCLQNRALTVWSIPRDLSKDYITTRILHIFILSVMVNTLCSSKMFCITIECFWWKCHMQVGISLTCKRWNTPNYNSTNPLLLKSHDNVPCPTSSYLDILSMSPDTYDWHLIVRFVLTDSTKVL